MERVLTYLSKTSTRRLLLYLVTLVVLPVLIASVIAWIVPPLGHQPRSFLWMCVGIPVGEMAGGLGGILGTALHCARTGSPRRGIAVPLVSLMQGAIISLPVFSYGRPAVPMLSFVLSMGCVTGFFVALVWLRTRPVAK